jgi:hypothetical protein
MEKTIRASSGKMKIFRTSVVALGALFLLSGCGTGPLIDKRAPGVPGEKKFQIQIEESHLTGPRRVWITVTERVWDKCDPGTHYDGSTCVG